MPASDGSDEARRWAFRVQVQLGGNYRWVTDEESESRTSIAYRDHTISLSSPGGSAISDSSWVAFSCKGFGSEDEARLIGRSLQEHLRVASVWSNMPLDVGETDEVRSRLGPDVPLPDGVTTIPEVHGLSVFEDRGKVMVFSAGATATSHQPLRTFEADLAEVALHSSPQRDSDIARACDFYLGATRSLDLRSQFLMLVSSLEQLAMQGTRSPESVQMINAWIANAATITDGAERQSLRSGLANLKRESIASAIRRLVAGVESTARIPDPEMFATQCYEVRSNLSHGNGYVERERIRSLLPGLYHLVRSTIRYVYATSSFPGSRP